MRWKRRFCLFLNPQPLKQTYIIIVLVWFPAMVYWPVAKKNCVIVGRPTYQRIVWRYIFFSSSSSFFSLLTNICDKLFTDLLGLQEWHRQYILFDRILDVKSNLSVSIFINKNTLSKQTSKCSAQKNEKKHTRKFYMLDYLRIFIKKKHFHGNLTAQ